MCSGESHTDASFSSFSTLQSYLLSICQHFLQSVFDLSVSDLPPLSLPPSILLHSLCHSVIFSFPSSPSVFTLCPLFYFCPPPLHWTSPLLQVPLPKEQKQRFRGVQHIHRETPVHREGPSLRPASTKLYLVSAAGSGWVRKNSIYT